MSFIKATQTVSDVSTYVKRQFGDEAGVQITDADIIRWINLGEREIFLRNKPIKARGVADTVAGQYAYTFPDDILEVQTLTCNGQPVERRSFQEAQEYIFKNDPQHTIQGQPNIWYEWGGDFMFWPIPSDNASEAIAIYYVKSPITITDIGSTLSVPDSYYGRLLEFVMAQAYELDENWAAAQVKAEQFDSSVASQDNDDDYTEVDTYPRITVLAEDM